MSNAKTAYLVRIMGNGYLDGKGEIVPGRDAAQVFGNPDDASAAARALLIRLGDKRSAWLVVNKERSDAKE